MRPVTTLPIGIVLTLVTLTAAPAAADGGVPSESEGGRSQQQVGQRATEAGRVTARLARANGRLDELITRVETLVERYNGERVQLRRAEERYRAANRRVAEARARVRRQRQALGRIAAENFRTSTSLVRVGAMFAGAPGPGGVLDRADTLTMMMDRRTDRFDRMRALRDVAQVLREQAHEALENQREATREVAAARRAAQAAVAEQRQAVQRIQAEKRQLTAQLEQARATGRRLERERERTLARQVVAGASGSGDYSPEAGASARQGDIAADWALTQLGKPYVWAADGPDAYDCSGLTMRAWEQAGVQLDHWTGTQWTSGPHIPLDQLRRGDLVFFGTVTEDPGTIHHVGIYIGNGRMVEAPYTGAVVRISSIWRSDLVGATRPADPAW